MRIKNLLVLALTALGTALTAQAQIVKEDFSAAQTKTATDQGYYEFINLHPAEGETAEGVTADKWTVGDGVLSIENSADFPACNNQKWQRAIKFRNLPLTEKKLYKLSFDLKTNDTYVDAEAQTEAPGYVDMKIMQGDENADICIQGADGSEQRANFALASGDSKTYSKVFYFADLAKQNAAYEAACAGKENYAPGKFFAGINVYTAGSYVLDNVLLEEATALESVGFYGQAIKIYYGDKLNAEVLCAGTKQYVLDNSCANVTIAGEPADIVSVELKSDGYLYIFLDNELGDGDVIKVSFKAPEELQFAGAFAGASLDFADATAVYDETIDATSWLYDEPALVSSNPADGTFALDQNISEFTFTFDKPIDIAMEPAATLNGEELKLITTENSNTITFKRESTEPLKKDNYTLEVTEIYNEYATKLEAGVSVSFEVGKVKVAETVYSDYTTTLLEGANGSQPTGWSIMVGGSSWTGGTAKADDGSACRNINVTGTDGVSYTAFYLCDRAGYTYMQSPETALPKGNIEFSLLAMSHDGSSASRAMEYRIEATDGTVLASGSGATSIGTDNFTTADAASMATVKFENPAEQNVIIKVRNAAGAWEGARVLGFKYRTYTMTEGETFTPEVVATGDFSTTSSDFIPAHGTGWKIYRSATQMRDPGYSGAWGGTPLDWTGGGGPRVKHPGNKGFNGGAIYLANATYATYGEYLYQTDHTGELTPQVEEKTLTVNKAKYQVTYYILAWKQASTNSHIKLEIFHQEDSVKGTPVYSREDFVAENSGPNGCDDASADAKKIQFFWTAPSYGKYILKFTSTDESLFGNVSIQTTASLAVQYAQMMNEALEPAKAELALANADEKYAGTTRTALDKAIKDYTNPDFHTVAEYDDAIANVNALVKASAARRDNIDKYPGYLTALSEALAAAVGTKYEQLDAFKTVSDIYAKYGSVDPSSLEDEELAATTVSLNNYGTLLANMTKATTGCVALLTKQTDDLAAMLNNESDPSVVKSKNSVTDDQELAYILKLKNLKAIYDKCAAGDPFYNKTLTEDLVEEETFDSLDVSAFIQNRNLYSTCTSRDLSDTKCIPGWNFPIKSGTVSQQWSWSAWSGSEYCPVTDAFLLNGWNGDFAMEQNVSLLPVGTYRYVSGTQDRGFADTSDGKTAALETMKHWTVTGTDGTNAITGEIFSYIYWKSGDKRDSVAFDITDQGQWYSLTEDNSTSIAVNASGENPYGDLLIGTRAISYQSSASVDNFKLYMIGKKEGFDYAAAAKAVQELIDGFPADYDVNSDNAVDKLDVDCVVKIIAGGAPNSKSDVNNDGRTDVLDINAIIGAIVNDANKQE